MGREIIVAIVGEVDTRQTNIVPFTCTFKIKCLTAGLYARHYTKYRSEIRDQYDNPALKELQWGRDRQTEVYFRCCKN